MDVCPIQQDNFTFQPKRNHKILSPSKAVSATIYPLTKNKYEQPFSTKGIYFVPKDIVQTSDNKLKTG